MGTASNPWLDLAWFTELLRFNSCMRMGAYLANGIAPGSRLNESTEQCQAMSMKCGSMFA